MKRVITLVVDDYYVGGLIRAMQRILSDQEVGSPPHITIRGPYESDARVGDKVISNIQKTLKEMDGIWINGFDYFYFEDSLYVSYLRVENESLRRITWKKEYPVGKYGFNPHITICKTFDFDLIEGIRKAFDDFPVRLFVPSSSLKVESHPIGLSSGELFHTEYATIPELIEKTTQYRTILWICNDLVRDKNQLHLFDH